jgi:hypothetical protein
MALSNNYNDDGVKLPINIFLVTHGWNALRSFSFDLCLGSINMYELALYFDS